MSDLNVVITSLLAEVKKNQIKNGLFSNQSFPSLHAELEQNRVACFLTPEELAAADVTIERIELDKVLADYVLHARYSYKNLYIKDAVPAWLLLSKTYTESFADFFANIASLTDTKFWQMLSIATDTTLEHAQAKYTERQDLIAHETLHKEARNKVQHAIDLRDFLEGTLKLFGYSALEIDGVAGKM